MNCLYFMLFVDAVEVANRKIVLTVFKSIQMYNVFIFSLLFDYSSFMIYILNFLTIKILAFCFSFIVYIEHLCFTYRGILLTNIKGSLLSFCFLVKLYSDESKSDKKTHFQRFLTEKKDYNLL